MEQNNAIEIVKQMVADGQVAQDVVEKYFPELKEEYREDKMREMAIKAVHAPEAQSCIKSWGVEPDDVISWLEDKKYNSLMKCLRFANAKIGELVEENYKLRENQPVKKTIELGKTYRCLASPRYTFFKKGDEYKPKDVFLADLMELCSDCFKLVEDEEPIQDDTTETNEVAEDTNEQSKEHKPKFKIDDWIVYQDTVWKIDNIALKNYYEMLSVNNNVTTRMIEDVDSIAHLWTIEDAKDGDVLANHIALNSEYFLFQKLNSKNSFIAHCKYHFIGYDCLCVYNNLSYSIEDVVPATKSQREMLFKKISDKGYLWDIKNKQLKKKEDIVKWTEEDDRILYNVIAYIGYAAGQTGVKDDLFKEANDWIKNIKDRFCFIVNNQWKPSSEQLDALKEVIEKPYKTHGYVDTRLESLYDDLKKLSNIEEL